MMGDESQFEDQIEAALATFHPTSGYDLDRPTDQDAKDLGQEVLE